MGELELMWPGKDKWEAPEPRILLEKQTFASGREGISGNLLIYGVMDNLTFSINASRTQNEKHVLDFFFGHIKFVDDIFDEDDGR